MAAVRTMIEEIMRILEGMPEPMLSLVARIADALRSGKIDSATAAERLGITSAADIAADVAAEKIENA